MLFLTALQIRFAAHLATLLVVFSGIGVVWILARADLTALPTPVQRARGDTDRNAGGENRQSRESRSHAGGARWVDPDSRTVRSGVTTLLVVALVVGVSGFYLPGEVEGGVIEDETYHTATWMDGYGEERGGPGRTTTSSAGGVPTGCTTTSSAASPRTIRRRTTTTRDSSTTTRRRARRGTTDCRTTRDSSSSNRCLAAPVLSSSTCT
ncbi:hypothetical protein ACFQL4_25595 [Halosimplex aquaticum]